MQARNGTAPGNAADSDVILEDVWRKAGERWDIAAITGGYRAKP